jgi:hypothetical protein
MNYQPLLELARGSPDESQLLSSVRIRWSAPKDSPCGSVSRWVEETLYDLKVNYNSWCWELKLVRDIVEHQYSVEITDSVKSSGACEYKYRMFHHLILPLADEYRKNIVFELAKEGKATFLPRVEKIGLQVVPSYITGW